ncbi:unnamed protein product [Linum tenue]|uniref:KIB1-4 beta-propeller domain-containing protein n=1 Tax=Linum tenue TaxID=586396 RepID=A0AAV0PN74_9ROSI|nr:unnamed protein product [Linum tenue]
MRETGDAAKKLHRRQGALRVALVEIGQPVHQRHRRARAHRVPTTTISTIAAEFTRASIDDHLDQQWDLVSGQILCSECGRHTRCCRREDVNSDLRITKLGKQRAVPDSDLAATRRRFKECLVESEGKVVLVFLCSTRSMETVDHVEVYRLELKELAWVRARSLGGAALFLGSNSCMSEREQTKEASAEGLSGEGRLRVREEED